MSEPIRVLHMIGSLDIGGSQLMIINLYKAIDRTKIQFDFVIDHPENTSLVPIVEELGARIYYMPTFIGKNILKVKCAWNEFFKEHPEYKILHSHVRSYATVYISIAKKYGIKTIIHSHSTSNGRGMLSIVKKIMQYPLRWQADYFFGCSKKAGEWLFGRRVINSDRYFTLSNAIDTGLYEFKSGVREEYRIELDLVGKLVFIHVGRLHPAKNHDFLLDVFAGIRETTPNAALIIVGDGNQRKEIELKISKLKLNNSVLMLGNRNDVANLLQVADCFLFPSKWEGLPMVVVEAQAAGLPCLVSECVSNEVKITKSVTYLPIDGGVKPWIDVINELDYMRRDVINDIKIAGFDVNSTAQFITKFYEGLHRNL